PRDYRYAHVRVPSSLATRRSSDLAGPMSGNASSTKSTAFGSPPSFRTISLTEVSTMFFNVFVATRLPTRSFGLWIAGSLTMMPRSEEHTSELQSRENLVGCLLLVK